MLRPASVRPTLLILAALAIVVTVVLALRNEDGEEPAPRRAAPSGPPAALAPGVPAPDAALPVAPRPMAEELTETTRGLRRAIDAWTASSDPRRERPPRELVLRALYHQRLYLAMASDEDLGDPTIALLPDDVRAEARDTLAARQALADIPKGDGEPPPIRIGSPEPPGRLRRHYDRAEERFGVGWELLAAVNLIESNFGRLRNASSAGAQGPMQFIPGTWEAYGMGGDVTDPRDAILGAANYLSASGAPEDPEGALFAYNRSTSYVEAVSRHARAIERDPRHFYALYAWQAYADGEDGLRRLTGPGR